MDGYINDTVYPSPRFKLPNGIRKRESLIGKFHSNEQMY